MIEPSWQLARNPTYTACTRTWDLSSSPSTTTTKYHCTSTCGPWSISPNGLQLCCLATKQGTEHEEDLFLSKCDPRPQKCTPCNIPGGMAHQRTIYPRGCPFSCDGSMIASVRVLSGALHLSITNTRTAMTLPPVRVSTGCPGFRGAVVDCTFSPNSRLLAVTSSHGQVYFLGCPKLTPVNSLDSLTVLAPHEPADLAAGNLTDDPVAQSVCCLFDPRFPYHEFVTCVMYAGVVKTWRMASCEKKDAIHNKCTLTFRKLLNVVRYSPDGRILAVGANDGTISCVDPDEGTISFMLDTGQQLPEFQSEAGVFHMAFTQSGEELASRYSDGYIRIWQLPVIFDLRHFCRWVINACVPPNQVQRLPLPLRLKDYLLYKFF